METIERRYDYLLSGPGAERLPPWIHVCISETEDNKWLTVYSRIHVTKTVVMNPSYSKEFSDHDILKDLSAKVAHRFL